MASRRHIASRAGALAVGQIGKESSSDRFCQPGKLARSARGVGTILRECGFAVVSTAKRVSEYFRFTNAKLSRKSNGLAPRSEWPAHPDTAARAAAETISPDKPALRRSFHSARLTLSLCRGLGTDNGNLHPVTKRGKDTYKQISRYVFEIVVQDRCDSGS